MTFQALGIQIGGSEETQSASSEMALFVNQARQLLLTDAGFAFDEERQVGLRGSRGRSSDAPPMFARADQTGVDKLVRQSLDLGFSAFDAIPRSDVLLNLPRPLAGTTASIDSVEFAPSWRRTVNLSLEIKPEVVAQPVDGILPGAGDGRFGACWGRPKGENLGKILRPPAVVHQQVFIGVESDQISLNPPGFVGRSASIQHGKPRQKRAFCHCPDGGSDRAGDKGKVRHRRGGDGRLRKLRRRRKAHQSLYITPEATTQVERSFLRK